MVRVALIAVVALAGCKTRNELSCFAAENRNLPECSDILVDAPEVCTPACEADTPVCFMGQCVQCVGNMQCVGNVNGSICTNNTCGPCTAHAQCMDSSNVCDFATGTCAAEIDVIYVQADGTSTECAQVMPCANLTIAKAQITLARRFIRILGSAAITDDKLTEFDTETVTIFSERGTPLTRSTANEILKIKGTANVTIHDLMITGASGMNGHAIVIEGDGDVTLDGVFLHLNTGFGVLSGAGGLLTIRRSIVSANARGGISVAGLEFDITNSIIVANGSPSSVVGGASLSPDQVPRIFDFNTVADNSIEVPSVTRGGVQCGGGGFTARGNIHTGNQLEAGCSFEHSLFTAPAPSGTGNIPGLPQFVETSLAQVLSSSFYRIADISDAAEKVPTSITTLNIDIDKEPRLQGTMIDMGADETK